MAFKFRLKFDFEIIFCLSIAISAGIIILFYYFHNHERRIERYLLKHKKGLFVLLEIVYFILIVSVVFNTRYILSIWMNDIGKSVLKSMKIKMPISK
jgi:hypothetical protein